MPDAEPTITEPEAVEINLRPTLDSPVDELAIRYAYLYLLGREPESDEVVQAHLSTHRAAGSSLRVIRHGTMESPEYRSQDGGDGVFPCVSRLLKSRLERGGPLHYELNSTSDQILLLQTSDAERYAPMLATGAKYNQFFAKKHGLRYESYIGIKRGCYPHHATLNRIFLLKELIDQGYRGWVLYLDADCIIADPNWDLRSELRRLRDNGNIMLLHLVFPQGDPKHSWWNINAGAFAIDLAANHARILIDLWAFFYDFYAPSHFENAKHWTDIIDDQGTLHFLLRESQKYIDIRSELELTQFHINKVVQALRSDAGAISDDEELERRRRTLEERGERIWTKDGIPLKRKPKIGIVVVTYSIVPQNLVNSVPDQFDCFWYVIHHGSKELINGISELFKNKKSYMKFYCENRGLARSWNEGIALSMQNEDDITLVVNDDIEFLDNGFAQWVDFITSHQPHGLIFLNGEEPQPDGSSIVRSQDFACFSIGQEAKERVGAFDENFVPAYCEDTDYFRRAVRAGISIHCDGRVLCRHLRNNTMKNDEEIRRNFSVFHEKNVQYLIKKWGVGPERHDFFDHPFNDPQNSLYIPWPANVASVPVLGG